MKYNEMRERLITKGVGLFYKKGFARSSIRDIGHAAGISSATLYHYFEDKDTLLYEIIKGIGEHLLIILNQVRQEVDDPEQRLRMMIFRQICLLKEKREEVKIYMEEQYQLPKKFKKIIYKQHREIYDTYLNELERLLPTGRLKVNHLPSINFAFFAVMNWIYRWYKENKKNKPLSIEELADEVITILFDGFLLRGKDMKAETTRGEEREKEGDMPSSNCWLRHN